MENIKSNYKEVNADTQMIFPKSLFWFVMGAGFNAALIKVLFLLHWIQ